MSIRRRSTVITSYSIHYTKLYELANGNRLQDILTNNIVAGRTGNEVLRISLNQAKDEGITPSIYTHPIGYHGHAAGTTIGMWDQQDGVPGDGDYPISYNFV